MDAVIETKEKAEVEIEVQVHGMTAMFQSKRSLIGNYFEYQGREMEIEKKKSMNQTCCCMIKSATISTQFF
ncbi:hypothetical protein GCM10020331_036280 [Ectobacillus funiculus]